MEGADTGRLKEGVTSLLFVVFGLRLEEQMSLMHRSSQQDACNWRSGIWTDQLVDLIGNRLHQQEPFVVFFSASRQLLYTWVYCCIFFYFIHTKLYQFYTEASYVYLQLRHLDKKKRCSSQKQI